MCSIRNRVVIVAEVAPTKKLAVKVQPVVRVQLVVDLTKNLIKCKIPVSSFSEIKTRAILAKKYRKTCLLYIVQRFICRDLFERCSFS